MGEDEIDEYGEESGELESIEDIQGMLKQAKAGMLKMPEEEVIDQKQLDNSKEKAKKSISNVIANLSSDEDQQVKPK